ncbi:unnamed protein product [Symbiodinium sp. CCMP2456]|nr:unnamed protein product [Symbiodinium sp. CCMP2456]
MSVRKTKSVGSGLGVHGGCWGTAPHKDHPHLFWAQVSAALLILGPLAATIWTPWRQGCGIGGSCSVGVQLSMATAVPLSIVNHLGHAVARRWIPLLQKLDRTTISLGCVIGAWALSQDLFFTVGSALLASTVIILMWFGSPRYRDSEVLASSLVAVCILYGLLPMLFYRESLDHCVWPAGGAILAGFALFQFDPLGVWTDSVWHLVLIPYAHFCSLSAVRMDQCIGASGEASGLGAEPSASPRGEPGDGPGDPGACGVVRGSSAANRPERESIRRTSDLHRGRHTRHGTAEKLAAGLGVGRLVQEPPARHRRGDARRRSLHRGDAGAVADEIAAKNTHPSIGVFAQQRLFSAPFRGPVQGHIEERLTSELRPLHLEVVNESHGKKSDESHFHVLIVSEAFEGLKPLARHRLVNGLFTREAKAAGSVGSCWS